MECSAVVDQQTREGEVVSSNPAGRVSREFSAKNTPTSMKTGGHWLVAVSPDFFLKNFAIIFGFFRIFILPSVNLCRVLFRHSIRLCRVSNKKHSAKASLPINFLPSTLCRVRHSVKPLSSVFRALPSAVGTRQRGCPVVLEYRVHFDVFFYNRTLKFER